MKRFVTLFLLLSALNICQAETKMRTVLVYLPYSPGTSVDLITRILNQYGVKKNINFVPYHRPGGDGTVGIHSFLTEKNLKDSLLITVAADVSRPLQIKKFKETDLFPIGAVGQVPIYIVARPDLSSNNLVELQKEMIQSPDKYSWGMISKTFEDYLLNFAALSGIDQTRLIITKFNTNGLNAVGSLVNGHIDLAIAGGVVVNQWVKNNKIKILGTVKSFPENSQYQSFTYLFGDRWASHNGYGVFVNSLADETTKLFWEEFFKEFTESFEVIESFRKVGLILTHDPDKKELNKMLEFNRNPNPLTTSQLTPRQKDVVILVSKYGYTNKQIAKRLNIGESAVKMHIGAVLKKYALRDRTHLTVYFSNPPMYS